MATVMILGARSDIGLAVAHQFAKHGCDIQLAGRKIDHSQSDRLDLMVRYQVGVTLHEFDVLATETHPTFVNKLSVLPDIVVCAIGYLGNQPLGQNNGDTFTTIVRTNYEGPAAILGVLANKFESRGSGTLIGISSLAGLRGRASNYIYVRFKKSPVKKRGACDNRPTGVCSHQNDRRYRNTQTFNRNA